MYMTAMGKRKMPTLKRLFNLLMLVLLGIGLSLNNSRAVGEALLGIRTPFKRTPKYNLHNRASTVKYLDYLLPKDGSVWIELALAVYAFVLLFFAFSHGNWGLVFWLSLISAGFAYTAGISLTSPSSTEGRRQSLAEKRPAPGSYASDVVPVSTPAAAPNPGQD